MAQHPAVLDATIAHGFPFADIRDAGTSVLVTADGSAELAAARAGELARAVWRRRRDFDVTLTPVSEAIRYAREEASGTPPSRTAFRSPTSATQALRCW
jgi:microcystin degradation protein MlrC